MRSIGHFGFSMENLLELSTLDLKETFTPAQGDLSRLLQAVLSEFTEIIQAAGIELETDLEEGVVLSGDEDRLRRMAINLIDNAIKYNDPEKGYIRVSLHRRKNEAVIGIANAGITIAPEEQDRIFDQFYRVEKSRASTSGGSGLGLTIVKRIVELHGGKIELESEPGSRIRLHVVLPLREA